MKLFKILTIINSVIIGVLILIVFLGFVRDKYDIISTKNCNNTSYDIVRDLEGPYFLSKKSQFNYNQLKGGVSIYSDPNSEIHQFLEIGDEYGEDGLRFVPSQDLQPQDYFNIKKCYQKNPLSYVRNIIKDEKSGSYERCSKIDISDTNLLIFTDCKIIKY